MLIDGGSRVRCDGPDCAAAVENHRWGRTKAAGWFFTRDDDQAWCPEHVPDWVAEWRAKRSD